MANEVRTEFTADARQLFKIADLAESRIKSLNAQTNRLGQNPTFGGGSLAAPTFRSIDSELARSNSVIEKYRQENLRAERELTKQLETEEKARTRLKIREAKLANDAAIREIRERERAERQTQSGGLGIGSLIGGVALGVGVNFLKDATVAAFDAERANRKLSASATEAGLAFGVLADKNKEFARTAGLSETAATNITAKIAQLATFSGKPQNIDLLQKSFLDLSAAKGINSGQIDDLIGTILSGQDEGLNRLGISDPGQLYKAYAKEVGKTADQLSQFEKVQAATNAVVEKAAIFTGANADKMASLSGQAEKASATLDNLYTNFGQGLTQSVEFRNFLSFANDALGSLTTNLQNVKRELGTGKSPEQLADETRNKPLNVATALIGDFGSLFTAPAAALFDYASGVDEKEIEEKFKASFFTSRKLQREAFEKLFTAEKKILDSQLKDADEQKNQLASKTFATAFQSQIDSFIKPASDGVEKTRITLEQLNKLQKDFKANFKSFNESQAELAQKGIDTAAKVFYTNSAEEALKKFDRSPNLPDAQTNLKALNSIRKFLPTEKFEDFSDKLSDFIEKDIEKSKEKIKELSKTYNETFDNLFQKNNSENPIYKVFAEGEKALNSLKDSLRGLAPELQSVAEALQQKLNANSLFSARLDNKLSGLDLRDEADSFRSFKQPEIKDKGKFFEEYIEFYTKKLETDFLKTTSRYAADSTFGGNIRVSQDPFARINRVSNADGSFGAFSQSDARNDLLYSFDRVEGGLGGFSRRNRSFADLTQREKDDFIRSSTDPEGNNLKFQQRLDRQVLAATNSGTLTDDQRRIVDKKLISLTNGVDPSKLSDNQRDVAAAAREREALRLDQNEARAQAEREKQTALQTRIAESNEKLIEIAKTGGFSALEITLKDQTADGASLTKQDAPRPSQADTGFTFGQGSYLDQANQ